LKSVSVQRSVFAAFSRGVGSAFLGTAHLQISANAMLSGADQRCWPRVRSNSS
jgi:hypothetical protein